MSFVYLQCHEWKARLGGDCEEIGRNGLCSLTRCSPKTSGHSGDTIKAACRYTALYVGSSTSGCPKNCQRIIDTYLLDNKLQSSCHDCILLSVWCWTESVWHWSRPDIVTSAVYDRGKKTTHVQEEQSEQQKGTWDCARKERSVITVTSPTWHDCCVACFFFKTWFYLLWFISSLLFFISYSTTYSVL